MALLGMARIRVREKGAGRTSGSDACQSGRGFLGLGLHVQYRR